MIDAREAKANNCRASCLFYTQKLSGAAERAANFVLWDVLLTGAAEEERNYQTIWVGLRGANAFSVESLTFYRICMLANTTQSMAT